MGTPGDESDRSAHEIARLVRELYAIVDSLERLTPGRRFTLDGHLVGSVGEVLAEKRYGLTLSTASTAIHDATASDGRLVQIKAVQGGRVALRAKSEWLIVLKLKRDGTADEIYNGPGRAVWQACGRKQSNGQCSIGVATLRGLNECVALEDRIPRRGTA